MGSFDRPCEGLSHVYFRSTQFGGAPEILTQRTDFRLAVGFTIPRKEKHHHRHHGIPGIVVDHGDGGRAKKKPVEATIS